MDKKKFLFINLAIDSGYRGVNHGIAFLAPILKKHSYDVACLNIQDELGLEALRARVRSINPSIVGFSCISNQLKYLIKCSKELEGYTGILQIAGGNGPTLMYERIISESAVKGLCIGEGEIPLDNLLNKIKKGEDITDTQGFYWKLNGRLKKNPIPQFLSDLSNADFPDYSIFDRDFVVNSRVLHLMISRGCPYNCHYCCNKALGSVYPSSRGYSRLPSVEYSIGLIEKMVTEYPETNFIGFEDDCLIADKIWFADFSKEYQKKIKIPYRMGVRPECITPDIVRMMKESGCCRVDVGLESGNEVLRNNLLNRLYSNDLFIERCNLIKSSNIHMVTFNIVGLPYETRKQMEDTLDLNRKISPDGGVCTFFYPYYGTELYNRCKDAGILKSEDEMSGITNYNSRPSIKMSELEEKDCIIMQRKIAGYLQRQKRNAYFVDMISNLPLKARKPLIIIYRCVSPILTNVPILSNITAKLHKILHARKKTFY